MLSTAAAGFFTGGSLIVAIGAQNAYVLRQGVIRHHIGAVVAVCAASDAVLILAGVGGIGSVVDHASWVIDVVRWAGVAFLLWYAASSLRRAFRTESLGDPGASAVAEPRGRVIGRAVALTWLNPHVYLDTVLLIGAIAATHNDDATSVMGGQWWFGVGAIVASIIWFAALGFGARTLAPLLARPAAWKVLEFLIAATMILVALKLAFE
ncbi:LysE/ArgO family amino acid transporter [Nocardioides sp. WS12]|uniref:LysE/ArgO family amino acid transporter n=1 Tax=Nocardioides sp. WS12 TaxID=2486272 RepID=UPI0015FBA659|nr:LysE/ArgO family amino acid transporter [Nocardioides sp. WS12]